jgi:hypothetical protein
MGPSRYEPVERIKFLLESIDYSISFVLGIISKKIFVARISLNH